MNANELRIGNWAEIDGKNVQIESINPTMNYEELSCTIHYKHHENGRFVWYDSRWLNHFSPIELSKELLLKFGFNSLNGSATLFKTDTIYWNNGFLRIEDHSTSNCKYVHQLQNLYFALTGSELSLSSTH